MIFAAFDLDGILINSMELIYMGLEEAGYGPDRNNHKVFHFNWLPGGEPPVDFQWDLFFYRLLTERFDETEPIDRYVRQFMNEVYYDGKEAIRVVTARPYGALMYHAIKMTLSRHFPDIDFSIDICEYGSEKIRYLGDAIDIYFEDRRKTVLSLAKAGKIVFMRNDDYNQIDNCQDLIAIYNARLVELQPGMIVTFDDYAELIEHKVPEFINPRLS